eukprot:SAG31_NODE_36990_length_308_cov_0.980861_1_plen_74_part_01
MRKQSGGGGGGGVLPSFPGFGGRTSHSGSEWGYSFLFWFSFGKSRQRGVAMPARHPTQRRPSMQNKHRNAPTYI